jgi:hypothetical protein
MAFGQFKIIFLYLTIFAYICCMHNVKCQIHRAVSPNNYHIKYDENYTQHLKKKLINNSNNNNNSDHLTITNVDESDYGQESDRLDSHQEQSKLKSILLHIDIIQNWSLLKEQFSNYLNNGALTWTASVLSTMLLGASGILPVVILPHLEHNHHNLGKNHFSMNLLIFINRSFNMYDFPFFAICLFQFIKLHSNAWLHLQLEVCLVTFSFIYYPKHTQMLL